MTRQSKGGGVPRKTFGAAVSAFARNNTVPLIFVAFTLFGFMVSDGVTLSYLSIELAARFFRNAFLVLSLIIPVIAGLGLNFGIVVGAMCGQIAIIFVRYFDIGGFLGLAVCFGLSLPLAVVFGYLTGRLYNKTRGQEMIASLLVGLFADGVYQFIFLFAVGVIIKVPASNPLIKPDAIGLRTTIDMGKAEERGLMYIIDDIAKVPLMWAALAFAALTMAYLVVTWIRRAGRARTPGAGRRAIAGIAVSAIAVAFCAYQIATDSSFMVGQVPIITGLLIAASCVFHKLIMKTKLGQDFRSVGQSQHIAEVSGIDVDRRRILAVIISIVLAAWGQIIYLQNMGTLNTFGSHTQTGIFAVASLLVGGASIYHANYKNALVGTLLFNSMFIMSPEIGKALFGQALLGEYFRTFMVYGVIGLALGLHVWKQAKGKRVA